MDVDAPVGADSADVSSIVDLGSLSSWFAALVSAGLLGVNLFIRARDRPEPDWFLLPSRLQANPMLDAHLQSLDPNRGKPHLVATLTNVGDGSAYRVGATGDGCEVLILDPTARDVRGFSTPEYVPRMESGDEVLLLIWLQTDDPESAEVAVNWRFSPTRHQRHGSVTIRLHDQLPVEPPSRWRPRRRGRQSRSKG